MVTVLVDADIILYRAGYAAEDTIQWDGDTISLTASLAQAKAEFHADLKGIVAATGADKAILALTDPGSNFRKSVYPDYKKPRANASARKAKPIVFKALREWVVGKYTTFERPGLEADDVLGILATGQVKAVKGDKVVASIDKDLRSVPCTLYNWDTKETDVINEDAADRAFYTQVLSGDAVDGYPGCPGIGKVRAARMLEHVPTAEIWPRIVAQYEKAGQTADDAWKQAICARILRASDYDFKAKEVRLWMPPTGTR